MARNKYMQKPGRGNEAMNTPLAMHGLGHGKEKTKKFTVRLTDKELENQEIQNVSNYSRPIKEGKFLDGTKNTKYKFEVPKSDFKSNQAYKDLRNKGRVQKAIKAFVPLFVGFAAAAADNEKKLGKP